MKKILSLPVVYDNEHTKSIEKQHEILGLPEPKLSLSEYDIKDEYFINIDNFRMHDGFIEPASSITSGGIQYTLAISLKSLFDIIEKWQENK